MKSRAILSGLLFAILLTWGAAAFFFVKGIVGALREALGDR